MPTYGRHRTNGDVDYGVIASGQARAFAYDVWSGGNAWVTHIGFWGGKPSGGANPNVRLGFYDTSNLVPNSLLGETAAFVVSVEQVNGTTGAAHERAITNRTSQPQSGAVRITNGGNYAIAVVPQGGSVGHAMVQASSSAYTNKNMYTRTGVSGSLPSTYGHTSVSYEGNGSFWVRYTVNRAPTAATVTPNGLQTQSNVTFEGTFTDPDLSFGDRMNGFQYQIERTDTNSVVHDSGWLVPNSTEITRNRFSRSRNMVAGVPYRWRCRVRDQFGTASGWSAWRTFTINAGGGADTFGGITGKQNTQQPTPFTFVWRHGSGLQMNRYQIRIGQGSSVIRTGSEVAVTAANNATITASWANSFGSYQIPWGSKNVWWELRVRDSANVWTSYLSTNRTVNINSAPNLPSNLTPSNSAASSVRPKLRCYVSDDDGDSLTVKARIKNNAGTVLQTRTMTHVAGGWYEYQTTSSDLAAWGTFRWDARASDGTLWTGTQTSEANAQHSSEAVFIYASVPNVVLTSPVQDETYAGSVSVSWQTIPNQQAWRIVATDVESGAQVTQGEWNQNTNTTTSLSASSHGLRKGRLYALFVELRDTNSLVGSSSPIQFLIDYPLPTPIDDFVAIPQFQNLDTQPSSIQMTWEPYEGSDFERYTISRSIHGVPLTIARITNPNETWFTDLVPPSDSEIEYSIVLSTLAGIDEIDSEPAYATAQIEIEHVILQSAVDPNQRSILNMDSEREYEHANDGVMETPWGASAPIVIYGTAIYQRFSGEFSLVSDDANSARDHINALRRLWNSRQTICYRDERGRRFFGQITRFTEIDSRVDTYTVSLEITETTYNEGVSDG